MNPEMISPNRMVPPQRAALVEWSSFLIDEEDGARRDGVKAAAFLKDKPRVAELASIKLSSVKDPYLKEALRGVRKLATANGINYKRASTRLIEVAAKNEVI